MVSKYVKGVTTCTAIVSQRINAVKLDATLLRKRRLGVTENHAEKNENFINESKKTV